MTDWKQKLLAYLHDTPSKMFDIARHDEQSVQALIRAGVDPSEARSYNRPADHTAAAADRIPFPRHASSGMRCVFDGIRNAFHHPLGPVDGSAQLRFGSAFPSAEFVIEIEQETQPTMDSFGDIPDDLHDPTGQQWRARYFAHWRIWQKFARENDHRMAFMPADSRIPDHTIWNHMQVVSALAGCATADGKLAPAFLRFQIGPVQDFIMQAKSTRDLWSGSYLLSWLMATGLKALSAKYGPDSVMFPNLSGQPLFDLHWRDDLWKQLRVSHRTKDVWDVLGYSSPELLTPNLPNVFLAIVPAAEADEAGRTVEAAIRAEWQAITGSVWSFCKEAGLTGVGGLLDESQREQRFLEQTERFLSIAWQAIPWPDSLEAAIQAANAFDPGTPVAVARERVEAVIHMATHQMEQAHRDKRYYKDKETCTELNNAGLAWALLVAYTSWAHDAVRNTRDFPAWAPGGWSAGAANNKDILNGRDEFVAGDKEWVDRCASLKSFWPSLFKKPEWLGAVTLVKRVWHLAYLKERWGLQTDSTHFPWASTRAIAKHQPNANDDEFDVDEGTEEKHFAVLSLDGDEIGKWVTGEKAPTFRSQLADYQDGSNSQRYGALPYFENTKFGDFLSKQRPLSPSYHLHFSEALSNFALHCVRPIVEAYQGRLIYAGGDDVLALLPADAAIACARDLRAAFQGKTPTRGALTSVAPGFLEFSSPVKIDDNSLDADYQITVPGPRADVSVGIAIAHYKAPLQDVVRAAKAAEKRAKNQLGRSALAVSLFKRSGEIIEWGCQWASGGIQLLETILYGVTTGSLSSKFPHRVVELMEPYLLSHTPLHRMAPAENFDTLAIIEREFAHVLSRQVQARGDDQKKIKQSLAEGLHDYVSNLPDRSPDDHPSGAARNDRRFRDLIGLCKTAAFAVRTSQD